MSKHKNNVNPDHYKTRGREPQGRDVVHEVERAQYAEATAREKWNDPKDGKEGTSEPKRMPTEMGGRPDQPDEEPDTWGGEGGAGDHDPSKTRS